MGRPPAAPVRQIGDRVLGLLERLGLGRLQELGFALLERSDLGDDAGCSGLSHG
jgi:hypothetical protein